MQAMGTEDTLTDASIIMHSKRKYRNTQSHRNENGAGDLKKKQQRFEIDMYNKSADMDGDFLEYLITDMMSWMANDSRGCVNDHAVDNENTQSHEKENSTAVNLKEKQKKFRTDMYNKPADVDGNFVEYLTTGMMSRPADDDCEGVNDGGIDNGNTQSQEKKYRFKTNIYDNPADVDYDSVEYLTTDIMLRLRNNNYEFLNDDATENDLQYEIFLGSLKEGGNSYMREISEKKGFSEPLNYEAEDEADDEPDQDTQKEINSMIVGNFVNGRSDFAGGSKVEGPKVFSSLPEYQQKESVVENCTSSEPTTPNIPSGSHQVLVEELNTQRTDVSKKLCKISMQDGPGEERISKLLRDERGESQAAATTENKKDDKSDDEYQIYCNNLCCESGKLVFKYKDAPPLVYEGDSRTDNATYSMKGNPKLPVHAGRSSANFEEGDNCLYLGTIGERHPQFRKQVMEILREPYDEKEHQQLSKDILARTSVKRNIDLRFGREQFYTTNKDGKSLLDHHYDLKRKLQAAKNGQQELILLRGFFFWLQNLTQEGSFKPWLDSPFLELLEQAQ